MIQKMRIISIVGLLVVILAVGALVGFNRYPCGLHRQCAVTANYVRLTYPYGWQVQSYKAPSNTTGGSDLMIKSLDKSVIVALAPKYSPGEQNDLPGEQTNDSYEPIVTQHVGNIPGIVDVQFIDKTDTTQSGAIVAEVFTSLESVMSVQQYQRLGLRVGSYK